MYINLFLLSFKQTTFLGTNKIIRGKRHCSEKTNEMDRSEK